MEWCGLIWSQVIFHNFLCLSVYFVVRHHMFVRYHVCPFGSYDNQNFDVRSGSCGQYLGAWDSGSTSLIIGFVGQKARKLGGCYSSCWWLSRVWRGWSWRVWFFSLNCFNSLSFFWWLAIVEKSSRKMILASKILLFRKHSCILCSWLVWVIRRDRALASSLFTPDMKLIWAPNLSVTWKIHILVGEILVICPYLDNLS